jgi:hypothetical protein
MLNLSTKDISGLFQPFLVLAVVIAASFMLVRYTDAEVKRAHQGVTTQERLLVEARNKVQQSDQEKNVIERYVEPYTQLERAGIVGEEKRISWIDALRAANSEADLYGVEYELEPQQSYAFKSEVAAESLPVHQSVMRLRLELLHEGDLLHFFQALAAQKAGRFTVNECKLQRLPVNLAVPVNQPTLKAECQVAWITIAGPGPEEVKS